MVVHDRLDYLAIFIYHKYILHNLINELSSSNLTNHCFFLSVSGKFVTIFHQPFAKKARVYVSENPASALIK